MRHARARTAPPIAAPRGSARSKPRPRAPHPSKAAQPETPQPLAQTRPATLPPRTPGARVDLWVTIDNDLSAISPSLAAFVSQTSTALAAAANLPPSAARTLSVDRGSVIASVRLLFPADVPYATAAAFALRASGVVAAGEVAWLVGAGYEAMWGRVVAVRADVGTDLGEWSSVGAFGWWVGCQTPGAGGEGGKACLRLVGAGFGA